MHFIQNTLDISVEVNENSCVTMVLLVVCCDGHQRAPPTTLSGVKVQISVHVYKTKTYSDSLIFKSQQEPHVHSYWALFYAHV